MKIIDGFLNKITMYRLALYVLTGDLVAAIGLSFFKLLPFDPINLFASAIILITVCWISNKFFSKVFNVPTNVESSYITAFILILVITPPNNFNDFLTLGFVGVLSQISKYVLVINKKHIFNPAALAIFVAFLIGQGASWWIGNAYMLIPVLAGGLLIVRKVRRFSMVVAFLASFAVFSGSHLIQTILESPIFFFGFIMLTEPQTTPPKKSLQIIYGSLVGVMTFFQAPEIALLIGNVFSYLASPKDKLILKLKEKIQIGPDMFDFIFDGKLSYVPGQYMEWTLGHKNPDSRGSRRYFTLASSPTESTLRIGTKFYPNGSSWKKALSTMQVGSEIIAGQLGGEFNLPKGQSKKLVFLAGGIGITPFRSMIKYLIDSNQKRDIVLLYSVKTAQEIVYRNIFDSAKNLGVKSVYVIADTMGFIDEKMIKAEVADFKNRYFYISGPHSMVDVFKKTLVDLGVSSNQIKIDFFPGYV